MKCGLFATAVAACSLAKPVSGEGCGWAVHVEGPTNIALETKRVIHAEHGEYIEHVDFVFAFEEHDDHDDHRRMLSAEDHAFEWAGVFELAAASHTWSMQKTVGGGRAYADESMKLVLVPTTTPTEETMEAGEDAAEALMKGTCTEVDDGETMTPVSGGSCFELHVNLDADSEFTIDTTGLSGMSVYAQHVPTEFERTKHYLYDSSGTDIEPVAQEAPDGGHDDHDHGAESTGDAAIFAGAESWYASTSGKAACGNNEIDSTFKAFKVPASWQHDDVYNCVRVEISQYTADTTIAMNFTNSAFDGEALIMAFIEKSEEHDEDEDGHDGHDDHDHARALVEDDEEEHVQVCDFVDVVDGATGEPYAIEAIFKNDKLMSGRGTTAKLDTNWEPWIAALLINLVTLTGVIFMLPVLNKCVSKQGNSDKQMQMVERGEEPKKDVIAPSDIDEDEALEMVFSPQVIAYTSAFASGSLLSCAVMLICPEALHMIESGGFASESAVFWRWGTCFLVGFITPTVVGALAEMCATKSKDQYRVAGGVLIGDLFHNLTDGIFLGAAFAGCSSKWGWTIAASTVSHEITQEIADFFVLTTVCNMSPVKALFLNFLSGLSVFVGLAVAILGDISNVQTGYFLVYGGGVYVCVGGMECYSRVIKYTGKGASLPVSFFYFILGCVLIGLVLLDHEHCSAGGEAAAGGEDDAHAGHNH